MRRTEVELEENELGENARVQPQKDLGFTISQHKHNSCSSSLSRQKNTLCVLPYLGRHILKDMRRTEVELEENELGENARVQPQKESQMITEEMKKGGLDI
ncbi:BnaC04g51890D [Brassica napus]|uniref:BnaC04g51890D protein n=2 Tax=Brassica TaxID=3705 RepID=A0A078J4Z1_BRANA|nr:BnaC04g51890D [Brassica napus]